MRHGLDFVDLQNPEVRCPPVMRKSDPESAEHPIAQRRIRCSLVSTAQDDQLLLEYEILCDHRSHATGTNQLRGP
jgi:hypothetical protein